MTALAQIVRTLPVLAVTLVLLGGLEHFRPLRPAKFFYPGFWTNLGWSFVTALVPLFVLGPPAALVAWGVHAILPASLTGAAASLPLWARMAGAVVIGELGFYWAHRWSHEWPWLWRFHAVHHSAEHMSFLVNGRAHPVDMVFTRLCGLVLLYATGFASPIGPNPGLIPAVVLIAGSLWNYVIHANIRWRLGPVETLLASPAFHHWHHSRNDHIDHNYAALLPVFDRMFGTLYLPREWPQAYGTDTPMPDGLIGQLLEPFAPVGDRVSAFPAAPAPPPSSP